MTLDIAFRQAERRDMQAIQKLWNENTTWGELKEETLRERVFEDPNKPLLLLAHDEKSHDLVGQFLFVPSLLWIRGHYKHAYRPAAPIVAKGWRNFGLNPLNHPVLRMYREGCTQLKSQGSPLIYMVPSATWTRLFKIFPEYKVGKFPLFKLSTDERSAQIPSGISFKELSAFGQKVDILWDKFKELHSISVARNSSALPMKIRDSGATTISVEKGSELIGLLCMKRKDRQWLINDIMFADADDSLAALGEVALYYGQMHNRRHNTGLEKVSLLATKLMIPTLTKVGFTEDSYSFPLVVQTLTDGSDEYGDLSPEEWFVAAGD